MASFVALYRGPTIAAARLIGVSADPELVSEVAGTLLSESEASATELEGDRVVSEVDAGRRRALRLVLHEAEQ